MMSGKNDSGMTAAHFAVLKPKPSIEILEYMLERSPEVFAIKDRSGSTPVHVAASKGNKVAFQFFIKKLPALLQDKDKEGRHVGHLLSSHGHLELFESMHHKHGEILLETDGINASVAHYAAAAGKEGILEYIVSCIDNKLLGSEDWTGNTCAHRASKGNKVNILRFIAERQPELIVQENRNGQTPMDLAWSDYVKSFLQTAINESKLHSDS